MNTPQCQERETLVHLIRSRLSVAQAAQALGRSRAWGYKWWGRFSRPGLGSLARPSAYTQASA